MSIYLPNNALNKIQFVTIIETPTCLETEVQFLESYKTKE